MRTMLFLLRWALPWGLVAWLYRNWQAQRLLERHLADERVDHLETQLLTERGRREEAERLASRPRAADENERAVPLPEPAPISEHPSEAGREPLVVVATTRAVAPAAIPEPLAAAPAAAEQAAMPAPTPPPVEIPGPRDAASLLDEGNAFYAVTEFEQAVERYSQALEVDPNLAAAYYNRANAQARLEQNIDARRDYDRALELAPDDADVYVNRGLLSLYRSDYRDAEADFGRALELRPEDSAALTNRGLAQLYLSQPDAALTSFQAAARVDPDHPGAHYGAASAAATLGRGAEAVAALRRAIQLNERYLTAASTDDRFAALQDDDAFKALLAGSGPTG